MPGFEVSSQGMIFCIKYRDVVGFSNPGGQAVIFDAVGII